MNDMNFYFFAILGFLFISVGNTMPKSESDLRNEYFQRVYRYACQLMPENIDSYPLDKEHAAQQELVLDKAYSHRFKARSDRYYLQLAIINWDEKFIVMIGKGVLLSIDGVERTGGEVNNYSCPEQGRLIHHFNTHEWASYMLELSLNEGEDVWVTIVPEGTYSGG